MQIGPQYISPVVLCSLFLVSEETSPWRNVVIRTMNDSCHLEMNFDCPHASGSWLFLSNRMPQALMFS